MRPFVIPPEFLRESPTCEYLNPPLCAAVVDTGAVWLIFFVTVSGSSSSNGFDYPLLIFPQFCGHYVTRL